MIGERLKKLRKKAGMRQEDLARLLSLAPSTIAMYENGQRDPDTSTLDEMANIFDCSSDYLLGRTDKTQLALLEDLPEELRAEGVKALQLVKEAVKDGLTAEELAGVIQFVQKMNRGKKE